MAGRRKVHGDELNPEIVRLYTEEKLSMSAISKKLGIHPQVIKRKLQASGVEVRNKSQAMTLYHSKKHEKN